MFPIRDHTPSDRWPIVTILLIVMNIFAFYLEMTAPDLEAFISRWALIPADLDVGDPTTLMSLVTSQFLHAGIAHIGFNMWYLWIFGDNVEGRMGHIFYLLFYLACGVVAGLAQWITVTESTIPTLGASGAVAGVLGAYLALYPGHRVDTLLPTPFGIFWRTLPASFVLLLWFVTQLFNGWAALGSADAAVSGGTAWWAHIGGFAAGWIVGVTLRGGRAGRPSQVYSA